ncbi:hypothetical protein Q1695_007316 [Nippostrongylus brasiliensis]|nr:hypothetical protein Q1695_007316 [Nippostrongylus brasiliensis]
MSGTWEFIKRHKGKIIAGGLLVGGAAAYALNSKDRHHQLTSSSIVGKNDMKLQARRLYVFDTNHRACDQSISDIIPNLQTLIRQRFDIESLIYKLKEDPNLSMQEKVEIWNRVKILSVSRIVGVAYSFSLLSLAMKAQISILAADICAQFERPQRSWMETVKSQVESYFGFEAAPSSDLSADDRNIAASRKVFIQCIQYLTNTGASKLLDFIESACTEACSSLSLTDQVDQDGFRDVLDQIDGQISNLQPNFFSKLIAPLSEEERSSGDGVMQLLTRLVKAVESKHGRETLINLVDFYLTAAVHLNGAEFPFAHFVLDGTVGKELELFRHHTDISCPSNRRQAEGIAKDACADEFSKLFDCVKKQRANRILTFFKYNYKIVPPFRVLVDGTFCNAALANKINLREQLPKYLGGVVEIATTKCVLSELESIGSPVYGALVIARQFELDVCPHTPHRPAAECLAHLARRATKGKTKYVVATNDDSLSEKLREIAGTPILYIKYNAILLDRVSETSKSAAEAPKSEIDAIKALKAAVLGEQEVKKKKRKIKGANPLSCKKKKKTIEVVGPIRTGERTASGKRKRSKKKTTTVETSQ